MSLKDRFDALKQISTLLTRKEDVPDDLWGKAELKPGSKLKIVNDTIASLKKKVSQQTKEKQKEEEGSEDEEERRKTKKGFMHESDPVNRQTKKDAKMRGMDDPVSVTEEMGGVRFGKDGGLEYFD